MQLLLFRHGLFMNVVVTQTYGRNQTHSNWFKSCSTRWNPLLLPLSGKNLQLDWSSILPEVDLSWTVLEEGLLLFCQVTCLYTHKLMPPWPYHRSIICSRWQKLQIHTTGQVTESNRPQSSYIWIGYLCHIPLQRLRGNFQENFERM